MRNRQRHRGFAPQPPETGLRWQIAAMALALPLILYVLVMLSVGYELVNTVHPGGWVEAMAIRRYLAQDWLFGTLLILLGFGVLTASLAMNGLWRPILTEVGRLVQRCRGPRRTRRGRTRRRRAC